VFEIIIVLIISRFSAASCRKAKGKVALVLLTEHHAMEA
jgi:hypothetical protein